MNTLKKNLHISHAGLYGFYDFAICKYIKQNYIFSGVSIGAWNSLIMTYKHTNNYNKLVELVFKKIKTNKIKSIKKIQLELKNILLTNSKTEDYELDKLFIVVCVIENKWINNYIYTDFDTLENAIDCCIASSNYSFVSCDMFYKFQDKISYDGRILRNKKIIIKNPNLIISNGIFGKKEKLLHYLIQKIILLIYMKKVYQIIKIILNFINFFEKFIIYNKLYMENNKYYNKYLKYKEKYLNLLHGGETDEEKLLSDHLFIDLRTKINLWCGDETFHDFFKILRPNRVRKVNPIYITHNVGTRYSEKSINIYHHPIIYRILELYEEPEPENVVLAEILKKYYALDTITYKRILIEMYDRELTNGSNHPELGNLPSFKDYNLENVHQVSSFIMDHIKKSTPQSNVLQGSKEHLFVFQYFIDKPWYRQMRQNLTSGSRHEKWRMYLIIFGPRERGVGFDFDLLGSGHDDDLEIRADIIAKKIKEFQKKGTEIKDIVTIDGHGRLIRRLAEKFIGDNYFIDEHKTKNIIVTDVNYCNHMWHEVTLPFGSAHKSEVQQKGIFELLLGAMENGYICDQFYYVNLSGLVGQKDKILEIIERLKSENCPGGINGLEHLMISFAHSQAGRGPASELVKYILENKLGLYKLTKRSFGHSINTNGEFITMGTMTDELYCDIFDSSIPTKQMQLANIPP
jgi:hypothetical protein